MYRITKYIYLEHLEILGLNVEQKGYKHVAGVCFVCNFFAENLRELVTAPSESLPTRQNGVKNRDKAYFSHTENPSMRAKSLYGGGGSRSPYQ